MRWDVSARDLASDRCISISDEHGEGSVPVCSSQLFYACVYVCAFWRMCASLCASRHLLALVDQLLAMPVDPDRGHQQSRQEPHSAPQRAGDRPHLQGAPDRTQQLSHCPPPHRHTHAHVQGNHCVLVTLF